MMTTDRLSQLETENAQLREALTNVVDLAKFWINKVNTRRMSAEEYKAWVSLGHQASSMRAARKLLSPESGDDMASTPKRTTINAEDYLALTDAGYIETDARALGFIRDFYRSGSRILCAYDLDECTWKWRGSSPESSPTPVFNDCTTLLAYLKLSGDQE